MTRTWASASMLLLANACAIQPEDGTEGVRTSPQLQSSTSEALAVIIDSNKETSAAQNLLERIIVNETSMIEFYEPMMDGEISISVVGVAGTEIPNVEGSVEQVFKRHAGGERMSPQFRRALTRQNAQNSNVAEAEFSEDLPGEASQELESTSLPAPALLATSYCSWTWFKDNICATSNGGWDYEWELSNRTGNFTLKGTNWHATHGAVCADNGNITFEVSEEKGGGGAWTVNQGTYRWHWRVPVTVCNPFCRYNKLDTEYRVRNASGDNFHTCGYFNNW